MYKTSVVDITTTFNDIPHLATTLWYSGCNLKCDGCQNTILEQKKEGLSISHITKELTKRKKVTDWVVHLGGNPLDSIEDLIKISNIAKELGFKQFLYSGYTYSEFLNMFDSNTHSVLLNNINYVKTGRFDVNYNKKNCFDTGTEYFFETLNQEVYESKNQAWEKFYSFDFNNKSIHGSFLI